MVVKISRRTVNWFCALCLFFSTPSRTRSPLKKRRKKIVKNFRPKIRQAWRYFPLKSSSQYKSRIWLHLILTVLSPPPPPSFSASSISHKNPFCSYEKEPINFICCIQSEQKHNESERVVALNRLWFFCGEKLGAPSSSDLSITRPIGCLSWIEFFVWVSACVDSIVRIQAALCIAIKKK